MTGRHVTSVLIVDDSAMVRKVLSMGFEADPNFRVAGVARDVDSAERILKEATPDVITLDIEMPHVDGLTWLRQLMSKTPIPVVIITSLTKSATEVTMEAMENGAVDVIDKPMIGAGSGLGTIMSEIKSRVLAASKANLARVSGSQLAKSSLQRPAWPSRSGQKIMAIGSSTGGVQALARILPMFPADSPGILIVQHMPEGFTAPFARRLDGLCPMEVREASHGDLVQDGQILLAPGGSRHLKLERFGMLFKTVLEVGPPVCFSRPSVDVLMHSLAATAGENGVGAILTGMGRDGAAGLLAIHKAGGFTVAQNAETSVVFGMPAAAIEAGGADHVLPLDDIPAMMLRDRPQKRSFSGAASLNSQDTVRQSWQRPN